MTEAFVRNRDGPPENDSVPCHPIKFNAKLCLVILCSVSVCQKKGSGKPFIFMAPFRKWTK